MPDQSSPGPDERFGCDRAASAEELELVEAMPAGYGEAERLAEFRRLGAAVFEEGPLD